MSDVRTYAPTSGEVARIPVHTVAVEIIRRMVLGARDPESGLNPRAGYAVRVHDDPRILELRVYGFTDDEPDDPWCGDHVEVIECILSAQGWEAATTAHGPLLRMEVSFLSEYDQARFDDDRNTLTVTDTDGRTWHAGVWR